MKNSLALLLMFPLFVFSQRSVSFSVIDSLTVPPFDSALAHAFQHSPLLFDSQLRVIRSEHIVSKWGFAASLVPSPTYSFSSLDRGWRLSFSVGSLVSALKDFSSSRARSADNARILEESRESLFHTLLSAYLDFEKSLAELSLLESSLASRNERFMIQTIPLNLADISDVEIMDSEMDIRRCGNLVYLKRLEALKLCLSIYRISGFLVELPVSLPSPAPKNVSMGL